MRATCLWWLLLLFHAVAEAAELSEPGVLRAWIKDMKSSARGPFAAIRWFCRDGILAEATPSSRGLAGAFQHPWPVLRGMSVVKLR